MDRGGWAAGQNRNETFRGAVVKERELLRRADLSEASMLGRGALEAPQAWGYLEAAALVVVVAGAADEAWAAEIA